MVVFNYFVKRSVQIPLSLKICASDLEKSSICCSIGYLNTLIYFYLFRVVRHLLKFKLFCIACSFFFILVSMRAANLDISRCIFFAHQLEIRKPDLARIS